MKNIIIIGVILAVIDVAVLGIMKITGSVTGEDFMGLINDSLLIIAVLVVAAILIKVVMKFIGK